MKWLRRILFWTVLLAIVGTTGFFVYRNLTTPPPSTAGGPPAGGPPGGPGGPGGPGRSNANARPVPVTVAKSTLADMPIYLRGLGTVTALNTVTVRARVDGQLIRVLIQEGQPVAKGDLLAEVDPRPFQAQLQQAEGQLERDSALLDNARIDLNRYRTLFKQDSIAKQQVDTQEALVRQYEGTVKIDRGNVANARLQVEYTRITAPIDGLIGLRQVDVGNMVRASDVNGIAVITQVKPINVVFTLPEDNLPALRARIATGQPLTVDAFDRAMTDKLAVGVLSTIDNQIDQTTGTLKIKADFPNGDGRLFPNQFVNVRLHLDTLPGAIVVPTAAIQRAGQDVFVYTVTADNKIAIRRVKPGPAAGGRTAIDSGIGPDETIVVDGGDRLREDAAVIPTAATPPGTRDGQRPPESQRPPGVQRPAPPAQ